MRLVRNTMFMMLALGVWAVPVHAQSSGYVFFYWPNIAQDRDAYPTIYRIHPKESVRLATLGRVEFFALKEETAHMNECDHSV